jgi:hypothetical protein
VGLIEEKLRWGPASPHRVAARVRTPANRALASAKVNWRPNTAGFRAIFSPSTLRPWLRTGAHLGRHQATAGINE